MAKSKAKIETAKVVPAEVVAPPVEVKPVEAVASPPVAEPVKTTETATTTATTSTTTTTETKKSGGGCGKWIACCLVVLILCVACTLGTGYLLIFRTGDVIKAIANSNRDTTLTRVTTQEALAFNYETYFTQNPPRALADGSFETTIPDDVLLKMMFNSPDLNYMADFVGIKSSNGVLKLQIDIGSIAKYEMDKSGGYDVLGMKVDTSNFAGIYLNIELMNSATNILELKSVKLGDSFIDLTSFVKDIVNQATAEGGSNELLESFESLTFNDGSIVVVTTADLSQVEGSM